MNEPNELSPEARALLSQARGGDDPAPSDRARVHRALMASLAGGAGIAASSAASSAAASATATAATATAASGLTVSLTVKIAAVVLVVGAVSGTVAVAPWEEAEAPPTTRVADSRSIPTRTPALAAPVRAEAAHETANEAAIDEAAIDEAAIDEAAIDEAAIDEAAIDEAAIDEAARPVPLADPIVAAAPSPAAARAPPAASGRRTPRVVATTESPPAEVTQEPARPDPPPSPSTLAEETRLLRSAHSALNAGDPETALARLAEHARRFPDGEMIEEREAARILALCRADRREDARAAAARFLRERPTSPQAARVRSSCD